MADIAKTYLGVDVGTTNVKAMLVDADGRILARGTAPVQIFHTGPDGVEQDIEDIFHATVTAIGQVRSQADCSCVQAIGISSQGGALQPLDRANRCAGRVISWLDGRGLPYDSALTARLGSDFFAHHTGHGCSSVASGQIQRLTKEGRFVPGGAAGSNGEIARFGFVGDIIVARLSGRAAHDATSLSIAGLYNPHSRRADKALLRELGVEESQLPELLSPREAAGPLRKDVAELLGLPAGIPVSAAIHDQYAAALGSGACRAGDVNFGVGTVWVLLCASDVLGELAIPEAFLSTSIVENLYAQLVSMGNGGSAFGWALRTLGLKSRTGAELDSMIAEVPAGSEGLRFRPLLVPNTGVGVAPGTAGQLDGLRLSHGQGHILRAVLEGLAMELKRYLKLLGDKGVPIRRLVMCGAASASVVTPQIVADVTALPIDCGSESETSALGAAMIGRGLIDRDLGLAEISDRMVQSSRKVEPSLGRHVYDEMFSQYANSLPILR